MSSHACTERVWRAPGNSNFSGAFAYTVPLLLLHHDWHAAIPRSSAAAGALGNWLLACCRKDASRRESMGHVGVSKQRNVL
jgi:hypothetical protein